MKIRMTLLLIAAVLGALAWDAWQQHRPVVAEVTETIPAREDVPPPVIQALISPSEPLTLIHFWATWCPPCMAEMPEMLATIRSKPQGVHLVLISLDTTKDVLREFYTEHGITPDAFTSPIWMHDPDQMLAKELMPNPQLPATFVFRRNGSLLQRVDGPLVWDAFVKAVRTAQ